MADFIVSNLFYGADQYECLSTLGTGAVGSVWAASCSKSGKVVAIKKIPDGYFCHPMKARVLRELRILKNLNCPYIISLVDAYKYETAVYMVMNKMDSNLKTLMCTRAISIENISFIMRQLMCGLSYLYSAHVVHRDLKPENILVGPNLSVCIADFGLARVFDDQCFVDTKTLDEGSIDLSSEEDSSTSQSSKESSNNLNSNKLMRNVSEHVVTRYYRSPEIILLQGYAASADVWSIGCIMAELFDAMDEEFAFRRPIMIGTAGDGLSPRKNVRQKLFSDVFYNTTGQFSKIIAFIGTPSTEDLSWLPGEIIARIERMPYKQGVNWSDRFPLINKDGLSLMQAMLTFHPGKRILARDALGHPFLLHTTHTDETSMVSQCSQPLHSDEEDQLESTLQVDVSLDAVFEHYKCVWNR